MAIPAVVAGWGIAAAAAAGAAGGGILGNMFGADIDAERIRIEELVKKYQKDMERLEANYTNATSISDIINKEALYKKTGMGLDSTYLTDLSRSFIPPSQFNIYPVKEESAA